MSQVYDSDLSIYCQDTWLKTFNMMDIMVVNGKPNERYKNQPSAKWVFKSRELKGFTTKFFKPRQGTEEFTGQDLEVFKSIALLSVEIWKRKHGVTTGNQLEYVGDTKDGFDFYMFLSTVLGCPRVVREWILQSYVITSCSANMLIFLL